MSIFFFFFTKIENTLNARVPVPQKKWERKRVFRVRAKTDVLCILGKRAQAVCHPPGVPVPASLSKSIYFSTRTPKSDPVQPLRSAVRDLRRSAQNSLLFLKTLASTRNTAFVRTHGIYCVYVQYNIIFCIHIYIYILYYTGTGST